MQMKQLTTSSGPFSKEDGAMNDHLEFQLKHLLRNWAFRLLSLLVLALGSTCAAQTSVSGTITQLSTGSATDQQNGPVISGTNVVWTDVDTSGSPTNFDLFLLNSASGTPAVNLTSTPSDQEFLQDIDSGNIVWTHTSATSPGDIVLYNI